MAAVSAFTVASLQLGLDSLAEHAGQQGGGLGQEAGPILEGFLAATEILIESAEEVAASQGNPTLRDGIFDYARKLRYQSNILQVTSTPTRGLRYHEHSPDTA
jgi:hypothetical protein